MTYERVAGTSLDRRRKLTDQQKAEIHQLYHQGGYGRNYLAKKYNVSPRTIQFICHPERLERNVELARQRGNYGYSTTSKFKVSQAKKKRRAAIKLLKPLN